MILLIDNYDSFTYNLVQYFAELGAKVFVRKNDEITLEEAQTFFKSCSKKALVISPGPGTPKDAGISCALIKHFIGLVPILGVCLGHQCIGQIFGGKIQRASQAIHGKASTIYHDGKTIYQNLPNPFMAGRYHSLLVSEETLSSEIEFCAKNQSGEIMGLRIPGKCVEGVQFHPESILSPYGKTLLANFLQQAGF